jgi:hypothetical protein
MANDDLNWKLYGKGVLLFIDFYSGPKSYRAYRVRLNLPQFSGSPKVILKFLDGMI